MNINFIEYFTSMAAMCVCCTSLRVESTSGITIPTPLCYKSSPVADPMPKPFLPLLLYVWNAHRISTPTRTQFVIDLCRSNYCNILNHVHGGFLGRWYQRRQRTNAVRVVRTRRPVLPFCIIVLWIVFHLIKQCIIPMPKAF